jgi:hypothetical protein
MSGWRLTAATLLAAAGIGGAAGVLHARESTAPLPIPAERLLYLRSGRTADRLFLVFDAIAADVYWMRAIQDYGRDRKAPLARDRFALLQPLLDLTTTLDPHFNLAYRFGSIFLSMEPPNGPGRTDQAIALLEKGLTANPLRWQYAYDIGFIHYWYTGRGTEAAQWFMKAAGMPNGPEWLRPLAAVTLVQGGDRRGARQLLADLQTSPERYIQQAAVRGLAQLDALDRLDRLQPVVDAFRSTTGREQVSWSDLVRAGRLPGVPVDPTGEPFVIDPSTGRVSLSTHSSLAPLPRSLARS